MRAGNWGNKGGDYETAPRTASGGRDFTKSPGYNPRASGRIIKPWVISGGSGAEMFFSVGMWQGARVEIVPQYHLERPFVTTKTLDANKATLHISCEVFANAHSLQQQLHPWNNSQILHYDTRVPKIYPVKEKLSFLFELLDKNGKVAATKQIPLLNQALPNHIVPLHEYSTVAGFAFTVKSAPNAMISGEMEFRVQMLDELGEDAFVIWDTSKDEKATL